MSMVKRIEAKDCLDLRQKVLRPQQPPESCVYPGDSGSGTAHFGGFDEAGKLVCIATLFPEPREDEPLPGAYRLRGMATAPDVQGKGYGRDVLVACQDFVRGQGGSEIWCNARTTAAAYYLKNGFKNLSTEPFDIPGIGPHFIMLWKVRG
jgi:predicted GNAT family N-acyltransferase